MSNFIGQELLYDFVTGHLDKERKKSVNELLESNRELQAEVQKINRGMEYCKQLQQIHSTQNLIERVSIPNTYLDILLEKSKFEKWPHSLRWGLEVLFVALGVTIFAVVVPWDKIVKLSANKSQSAVIISEVKRDRSIVTEAKVEEQNPPLFSDEKINTSPDVDSKTKIDNENTKPGKAEEARLAENKDTKVKDANNQAPVASGSSQEKTNVTNIAANVAGEEKKIREGFLFRGSIKITNSEVVTPKIVERLSMMGARKAGEVPMGWKKGEGYYFHFTMPESKYPDLVKVFDEYGKLNISKEKHDRIMPDGIIRLIIEVNEAGSAKN